MTIGTVVPALLAQGATAIRDTLLVRPLSPVRSPFEELVYIASGLTSILTLLLVVALVIALLAVRRAVQRAHDTFDRRLQDFGRRLDDFNALLGRAHSQADRVVDMTGAAISGVEWGADKVKDFVKRKRRPRNRKRRGEGPSGEGPADAPRPSPDAPRGPRKESADESPYDDDRE